MAGWSCMYPHVRVGMGMGIVWQGLPQHQCLHTGKPRPLRQEVAAEFLPGNTRLSSALAGNRGCTSDPWMVSIAPQGNNLQTTCLGTRALKDSPEPCCGSSDSERRWWRHIPHSWQLVPVASVPPPSPGAQGDVFAEGEADNRGKWAVPCTPMAVAHGPGCCCPWQAEASGLSQPRLHVAGTLLFVLVPQEGSSAPLGTRSQNCQHLMA